MARVGGNAHNMAVGVLVLAAIAVSAQDRQPATMKTPSATSATGPQWDVGVVEGRAYKNRSVGIDLAPAPGLEFVGPPELKGSPGTVPLVVTITAAEAPTSLPGRKVMAYYSDALAYYPSSQRSTAAYLRKVVQGNQNAGLGFRPIGDSSDEIFGGFVFARQDFENGAASEGVLVKACEAQALVFIFAAPNLDGVNKLIAATELKLDPEHSGCVSETRPLDSTTNVGLSGGEIYRVSPSIKPPRAIFGPPPTYPEEARKGHAAGEIVVGMIVGIDGQARDVRVIRGVSPELNQAAVDAAEKWRFQPGTKEGKPVSVEIAVEFDFHP